MSLFQSPYAIKRDVIEKAKDLMKKYNALVARDAIHCAVTIMYDLDGIISADKDLKSVKEIHCFPP